MIKLIVILYVVCFFVYVLFSRQPDYFDGETTNGRIHFAIDSADSSPAPFVFFSTGKQQFSFNATYPLRQFKEGQIVPVIYDSSNPSRAAVLVWWGYWIRCGEILFSIVFIFLTYRAAVAITDHPAPDSPDEQDEERPIRRRKYNI